MIDTGLKWRGVKVFLDTDDEEKIKNLRYDLELGRLGILDDNSRSMPEESGS